MPQAQSDPQKTPYKWLNQEEYQQSGLDENVKAVIAPQSEESQEENMTTLIYKMMKSSKMALLHFNDKTRQFSIYTQPSTLTVTENSNGHMQYFRFYDDIRNRFSYTFMSSYQFGQRGLLLYSTAVQKRNPFMYSFGYCKTFWQRVDNNYLSNLDEIFFQTIHTNLKFGNSLQFILSRECRENYLNYYSKEVEKQHKFGLKAPDNYLPKYSNVLSLMFTYKFHPFTIKGKTGYDFANKSFINNLRIMAAKRFDITDSLSLNLSALLASVWGNNILKNDYIFGSQSVWLGQKFKNVFSPRIQLLLTKYPYLSIFDISPHIYTQLWFTMADRNIHNYDAKMYASYGVGMTSANNGLRFDISLFNFSAQKKDGSIGGLKFSF